MTSGSTPRLTRDPDAPVATAPSPGASRVAAIDCGTNSIRLLVADVDPVAGTLVDLDRRMEVVRLGQGVDRTGRLAPEALARTLDAARRYADVIADLGAARTRFVATSATRDAENRAEFVEGVLAALGVEPEVVSGEEEAALSFRGATSTVAALSTVSLRAIMPTHVLAKRESAQPVRP